MLNNSYRYGNLTKSVKDDTMFFDDREFIGHKIKEFRKKRRMTQGKLAELVDLSEKHISKIEAGIHQPSISAFFKIVKVLDIGLEEFGLSMCSEDNYVRNEILRCIYDSSDEELNFILPLIKCLKETIRKNN